MPFIDTPTGMTLHYDDLGNGPPLVLLHGWAMSARVWRFQEGLADCCRVITVDLRGHGRSGPAPVGTTLDDLIHDLHFLFARLDVTDSLLVGWSLGSQVALASFPLLRPRLAGLILVGGTSRFTVTDGYRAGLPSGEPRMMGLRLKKNYAAAMGEFFRSMFAAGELSREQENRIAREVVMGGRLPEPVTARAFLDILCRTDLRDMLPAIDRPVLLVHGKEDDICPQESARFMAARLSDVRLVMLEGTGHAPFLSRPEEFNRRVRAFIEEVYGSH